MSTASEPAGRAGFMTAEGDMTKAVIPAPAVGGGLLLLGYAPVRYNEITEKFALL